MGVTAGGGLSNAVDLYNGASGTNVAVASTTASPSTTIHYYLLFQTFIFLF